MSDSMLIRQLFDPVSSTYTYLIARRAGAEAVIVDPVREQVGAYLALLEELGARLVFSIDTHVHADHVTGAGALSAHTSCATLMGAETAATCVDRRVSDGEQITVDGLELEALHTPGHTDDSYCFVVGGHVLTGDTLLIGGTGRTDFQNGDARAQYESLFGKILRLPDETIVLPAHDYRGRTRSTIGRERATNPRLQVGDAEEYAALMGSLNLSRPRLIDIAVPANLRCGLDRASEPVPIPMDEPGGGA